MNKNEKYEGRYRYSVRNYKINPLVIDKLLSDLHEMQLDMIDEAVENSSLDSANEVLQRIMSK
jgi:hypothetical protein